MILASFLVGIRTNSCLGWPIIIAPKQAWSSGRPIASRIGGQLFAAQLSVPAQHAPSPKAGAAISR